ncbi:MAG TPA: ANTAR domain-containing protein [Dermatophilaceae bacterium]|nr:ANTAR domain-containing protein [Dermatophilaceae bacterium]
MTGLCPAPHVETRRTAPRAHELPPAPAMAAKPARPEVGSAVLSVAYDLCTGTGTLSPALSALLGVSETFSVGQIAALVTRVHEDDRGDVLAVARAALRGPDRLGCTFRVVDAAGHPRTAVGVGEPVSEGGSVVRLEGHVVDITEPVRAHAGAAVAASAANRAGIEQVKGALMLTLGVNDEAAFAMLRRFSNRHNVKLAVLAERVSARLAELGQHPEGAGPALVRLLEAAGDDAVGDGVRAPAVPAAPAARAVQSEPVPAASA